MNLLRFQVLNLMKHCCSFTKLHIKVFFAVKTYFSAGNGIVTNRSKTKKMPDNPLRDMPVESPSRHITCTNIAGTKRYIFKTTYKNIWIQNI